MATVTVSGCPGTVDPGASDALPSDAGNPSTGEGFGSPRAPRPIEHCIMGEIECPQCGTWYDADAETCEWQQEDDGSWKPTAFGPATAVCESCNLLLCLDTGLVYDLSRTQDKAPLHSVAECEIEDCHDCDDFWRDEYADAREGD